MNIKEFAQMLNGREYLDEISRKEELQAKELGYVVVYGQSDDLIEFSGAIKDEAGCFDGDKIYLDKDGLFVECDDNCKYSQAAKAKCKVINAIWCGEDEWTWQYKTEIPHATFEIFEGGEKFCKGIVFDIKDL